jgi:hypothetical protein
MYIAIKTFEEHEVPVIISEDFMHLIALEDDVTILDVQSKMFFNVKTKTWEPFRVSNDWSTYNNIEK